MSSQDEVEEFAAQLRHLKARTGRSYAQLARRLDMNASTLHRYCSGEVVPLGFASVERFAAVCGAGPAERIELHRRWVLAVAARQRARTAAESVPEAAGSRPAGGKEHRPAGGTAEPVSAVAAEPDSAVAGDPVPAVAAGPSPDLGGSPAEGRPGPAHERGAAGHPATGRPWYRRRPAATASVATVLVATALGALSTLPTGSSSADVGSRASGSTTERPAGAPPGSPASPSSPASSAPAGTAAVAPLTWTVNSRLWGTGCGYDYVIDKAPRQVPPPPAPQDAAPWARAEGAVHGGRTPVDITVQGRTEAAVVLEALRVRVVGRAAPARGTVYSTGQGCGGDLDPRSFAVDLDLDRPIARPVQGAEAGASSPARQLPYRVSSTDPEVLMVDARAVGCDCLWYLELEWSSQGRTGTERIDDHGLPFRTSGIDGLPHYWYAGQGWAPLTG
ncbi:transcriptional regulator with XRE-family HTH domain [Kitasatospora herbaricolor]|uniref:helix-turn-helix domain-containing protein n=1 Tax=Kitasatospora herbaricolor TaxID=68217 RepID=UPI001E38A64B|nr:helix-turn-helix transcriptional regulator [Kitasatospora herbaricolor]MDQ0312877.1 transcriptional regulator with XRE-family HTH domain [Kitasatospora herbaricolor]